MAESFAEVARVLLEQRDVDSTLDRICQMAAATIAHCTVAGVSIAEASLVTSRVRTDEVAAIVDDIQSEAHEGPCIDAIRDHEVFVTGALSTERRWPAFAAAAYDRTGIESILSLRLFANAETFGSLNLYSSQADAFDDQDIAVGSVFAAHAAVALGGSNGGAARRQGDQSRRYRGGEGHSHSPGEDLRP